MTRRWGAVVAAVVLAGGLLAGEIAAPQRAFACSCAVEPNAPAFRGDEAAVVVGRVGGQAGGGRWSFAVERWFKGGVAAVIQVQSGEVPQGGGVISVNTCGLTFAGGEHLLLSGGLSGGVLEPSVCGHHANVDAPEGQLLIAAAQRAFGPGQAPDEPAPEPDPGADLGAIAVVAGVGALLIVALALVVASRRRSTPVEPT